MAGILPGMPNLDRPGMTADEKIVSLSRYLLSVVDNYNMLNNQYFALEQRFSALEQVLLAKQEG